MDEIKSVNVVEVARGAIQSVRELDDLQLAAIAGGIGDPIAY
jgi:hypothetical protein